MNPHRTKTVFHCVPYEVIADADGCHQNLPTATVMVMIRPQGAITLNLNDSTVNIDLTQNVWNGPFHFDTDGQTENYVVVTGANIQTHIVCYLDTELNETLTAWS